MILSRFPPPLACCITSSSKSPRSSAASWASLAWPAASSISSRAALLSPIAPPGARRPWSISLLGPGRKSASAIDARRRGRLLRPGASMLECRSDPGPVSASAIDKRRWVRLLRLRPSMLEYRCSPSEARGFRESIGGRTTSSSSASCMSVETVVTMRTSPCERKHSSSAGSPSLQMMLLCWTVVSLRTMAMAVREAGGRPQKRCTPRRNSMRLVIFSLSQSLSTPL
mmetsp:Transcript_70477/g.223272  ORF Transcript_70477/g.223272 Transcript_70477/m.223272 type:complete len:227 (-) Transcript_70477:714-1394(-)